MHYARAFFTPYAFKALLYLASTIAEDNRAVESFSPTTETFTVLPVSLPAKLKLDCYSVAFIINGELVLLNNHEKQMARWNIECETQFRVSVTDRKCYSFQPPLIVGTEVYIANVWGPKVEKWSLGTRRFV